MMEPVVVIKLNVDHQETWRYSGEILRREPRSILLEARFNRDDMLVHGLTFRRDDRFVEIYYSDRWYNIYEIHDRDDDHVKGWYCNVSRPAEFSPGQIAYVDLALDLLVFSTGEQLVLDEDEFIALPLDSATRVQARSALAELQGLFRSPDGVHLEGSKD